MKHCVLIVWTLTSCLALLSPLHANDSAAARVDKLNLPDYRGRDWTMNDFADRKLVVLAFVGAECPLVKLYATRLQELQRKYSADVAIVGIDANQQDSLAELAHFARTHEIEFPLLKDPGNRFADRLGAERTPEVFVLDRERTVRYRGRIDDQYTYGVQRPTVDQQYLVDAIESLLADRPVEVARTEVVGCHIGRVLKPQSDSDVTYTKQISRILQKNCVHCHRAGEIAPFALTSYDEVVGWAEMISEVVREQRMPPWHANPEYGHFSNDARLPDEDQQLIHRWVDAGAPEGDPADLPAPRQFVEGWQIGEPDLVVSMSEDPFSVPATGTVDYQYFMVDPGFTEDKWVRMAECRPGNRAVVHHIIVAAHAPDRRGMRPGRTHGGLESDWITATAPGAQPLVLDDGYAKRIPAGSRLLFQMHYTPNGTPQQDRSCVGFVFADPATVKKEVATGKAHTERFLIPPGADNHRVEASRKFKQDTLLLSLFPHMHLRGKSFRYTAVFPDGREQILLDVPRYDFNWQNGYELAEPVRMPAGSRLQCVAHFDNSEHNLANPDPTKSVRWGDQTWEEMMIGYYDAALADEDLSAGK